MDKNNTTRKKYISPYIFYEKISKILSDKDIVPCSSGGAYTTFQQSFKQKIWSINNK